MKLVQKSVLMMSCLTLSSACKLLEVPKDNASSESSPERKALEALAADFTKQNPQIKLHIAYDDVDYAKATSFLRSILDNSLNVDPALASLTLGTTHWGNPSTRDVTINVSKTATAQDIAENRHILENLETSATTKARAELSAPLARAQTRLSTIQINVLYQFVNKDRALQILNGLASGSLRVAPSIGKITLGNRTASSSITSDVHLNASEQATDQDLADNTYVLQHGETRQMTEDKRAMLSWEQNFAKKYPRVILGIDYNFIDTSKASALLRDVLNDSIRIHPGIKSIILTSLHKASRDSGSVTVNVGSSARAADFEINRYLLENLALPEN